MMNVGVKGKNNPDEKNNIDLLRRGNEYPYQHFNNIIISIDTPMICIS